MNKKKDKINIYYRISKNSYPKSKIADKITCFNNFINEFRTENIYIIADNVDQEIIDLISEFEYEETSLGNAGSFRLILYKALFLNEDDIVLFQEDDYLHLPGAKECYLEGIEIADYVTLYDHPDKYTPAKLGGNPQIEDDGGELTKVLLTKSSHWKYTNSTSMTFLTKVKTLMEDMHIWDKYVTGNHPYDYEAFCDLISLGRKLVVPIPAFSTHAVIGYLSPLRNWNKICPQ